MQNSNVSKGIFSNFGYLSLIQIFNLLFPILIYPYLIRTVGKENYGTVVFAQSVAIYFALLVNFGFNVFGTDAIAKNTKNEAIKSVIVSSIICLQFIFLLLAIVFLFGAAQFFTDTPTSLFLLAAYLCLYEIAVPVWYFQGIQQMRFIAICNLITKLSALLIIFGFVRDEKDFPIILVAYFMGTLLCGIFSFIKIFVLDKVRFVVPKIEQLRTTLSGSFPLFISHSLGGITSKSNAFLIGSFLGKTELSYYDLSEKLTNMVSVFFANFSNALFPVVSSKRNPDLVKKSLGAILTFAIAAVFVLILFSDFIVKLIGGIEMKEASQYLVLMALSIIFRAIGPIISTSILVVNSLSYVLSRSFIWVFISYFLGIFVLYLLDLISVDSIIIVFLISLTIMIAYRIYFVIRKGFKHWLV